MRNEKAQKTGNVPACHCILLLTMSFSAEQLAVLQSVLKHKGSDAAASLSDEQRQLVELVRSDSKGILMNADLVVRIEVQFNSLDRTGDGVLSKDDFFSENISSQHIWRQLVHWIDIDGDQVITKEEFLKFYVTFALFGMQNLEAGYRGVVTCGDMLTASRKNLNNNILLLYKFLQTHLGDHSITEHISA